MSDNKESLATADHLLLEASGQQMRCRMGRASLSPQLPGCPSLAAAFSTLFTHNCTVEIALQLLTGGLAGKGALSLG